MKIYINVFLIALMSMVQSVNAQEVQDKTNWPEFISSHNLIWEDLPLQWNEGAFTGNGLLGMMVYVSEKDGGIVFSVGRSDVTDHRKAPNSKTSLGVMPKASVGYDFCRLNIGKIILKTKGKILSGKIEQDLWNAEIRGQFETTEGKLSFKAFTPRNVDVQIVEVKAPASLYSFHFVPGNPQSPRMLTAADKEKEEKYELNPSPKLSRQGEYRVCVQPLLAGGDYATAWTNLPSKNNSGSTFYITTANDVPKSNLSAKTAIQLIANARKTGLDKLMDTHQKWWHGFYQKSSLSIPDAQLESFYWIQLYKMATASRPGGPAVDLFGPYFKTSPWPGMWWNLNIQLTYYPVYTSNHLELGLNMLDIVDDNFNALLEKHRAKGLGDLSWTLHNYWKQLAYAGDEVGIQTKWLPKAAKMLALYEGKLHKNDAGIYELDPMPSPEYGYKGGALYPNANYNLAILRWLLNSVIPLVEKDQIYAAQLGKWKDIQAHLIAYPVNENGLMIASNQALEKSHRHYSHLLALYPLFQLKPDNKDDSLLVNKSVTYWHQLNNGKALAGYSFTGAASLYAALGNGNAALKNLDQLLNGKTGISQFHTNTFYTEGSGKNEVIETPLSGAASVMELLLQSWGGKIRVFPAMPTAWKNACFNKLLAEGGYEVSGAYKNGDIDWVQVKSKTGKPFVIAGKNISALKIASTSATFKIKNNNTNEVTVDLPAGQTILLKRELKTQAVVAPVSYQNGQLNSFGVKKGMQLKTLQDWTVKDYLYELEQK